MNKILVLAPHADDEILGCGATIANHVQHGDDVYVVICTNAFVGAPELFSLEGIENVRYEAKMAHRILGVRETIFLDFPAPGLNAYPEFRISLELLRIIHSIKPTHLYLPHAGDLHQDHKAIYRAGLVAARPINGCSVLNIYCYETLSETDWAPLSEKPFVPNHFVDVTEVYGLKAKAMQCYHSQLKDFPHSRSLDALESLAKLRGSIIGVNRAEAFVVERQIVKV